MAFARIAQHIKAVQSFIKAKHHYAVDIDLSKFFDQVDHDLLMFRLGQRINDKRVLALMGRYLRAGISDKGNVSSSLCGVPQGGPLSPLLAAEGQRIKQEVETFLKTLKLPINQEKSQVVLIRELCFLGYQFKGRHLIWSPKSLQHFKHRIRELTNRTWGVSWKYRYLKLKQYVVGWMNYFALIIFDPVVKLDHWIRRRIRMCYLHR